MKYQNKTVYENVAVLAIRVLNAEEVPFEEQSSLCLDQYQGFFTECTEIIYRGEWFRDVIMCNGYICGIYDDRCNEVVRDVWMDAEHIHTLVKQLNGERNGLYADKLIVGIGIAAGTAVWIPIGERITGVQDGIWMGSVFNAACSMAHMSICDGRGKIFAVDSL